MSGIKLRRSHPRQALPSRADALHFLHIGKAAGSQIKRMLEGYAGKVITHGHDIRLSDLPPTARYFFSIREPISRFYSGFYSRKRKGQPTYNRPWSPAEEVAFRDFPHANDLAEALFEDGPLGIRAAQAIVSIRHTGQNLVSWFLMQGNIFEVRPPVWIIRQHNLETDFAEFIRRANLPPPPETSIGRFHANDYEGAPPLSEKAMQNLRLWYSQDLVFYKVCESWMDASVKVG